MSVFGRFAPRLQVAIAQRLRWTHLRPVQELAGEALLEGANAVILAPTAGGKTEASMFPTLSLLLDHPPEAVGALYVAPIKALLNNQAERLGAYTQMVGLDRMVWHGDVGPSARKAFLKEPTELLMTTPESLEVMLISGRANTLFGDLRVVVIDEVHALAGTDRGAHLMSVIERLARLSRHDVQRVGLSATVGNPDAILSWLQGTSTRPSRVVNPPKEPAPREILVVHHPDLEHIATDAAKLAYRRKSLFFCQSRRATEAVAVEMRRLGTTVHVHHSAVSKEERALAEESFARGSDACIVATSTLELGIDVGDLDRVLQAEAPDTVSSFLQRMGRTGRRPGAVANTTFLCEFGESVLQATALVELAKAGWVESVHVDDRCWPVLVHQLLAMSLERSGVPRSDAWEQLARVPDFQGIHRAEFDRLINWMIRDRSLDELGGRLLIGPKAERKFGRRNFMELYAVFSSPATYQVETTAGSPLGSLSQTFVDRLVDGTSCFLLAGRAWAVLKIRHDERRVVVEPAPRGREPTWGGFLPQFLGFEVCQAVLGLLCTDHEPAWLHPSAREIVRSWREEFEAVLAPGVGGVQVGDGEIRWWTFAGGRINSTLRHALLAVGGDWSVVPDNFMIKVKGEGLDGQAFFDAVGRLREVELWEDDRLWLKIAQDLPNYRLSKFQALMPPWIEREMIAAHLLDLQGAWAWLTQDAGRALPGGVREVVARAGHMLTAVPLPVDDVPPRLPTLPVRWVATDAELAEVCAAMSGPEPVALDVETTLRTQALCLVQLAGAGCIALIDALEVSDLGPLAKLMEDGATPKIVHNASFERSVLAKYGVGLNGVIDTLALSRERRGKVEGGHSLKAVCARELGVELDKDEQVSDWARRPLTERQKAYAALDVEVLPRVLRALNGDVA